MAILLPAPCPKARSERSKGEILKSVVFQYDREIKWKKKLRLGEGIRVNLHGPRQDMFFSRKTCSRESRLKPARLDIEIPAELGGGSLLEPLVPYSFPAYVRVPSVQRINFKRYIEDVLRCFRRGAYCLLHRLRSIAQMFFRDETKAFGFFVPTPPRGMLPGHCCRVFSFLPPLRPCHVRPVHWGRLPGFVLRGSIPQLQVGRASSPMLRVHQWGYMRFNCRPDDTYDSDTPLMWKHLEDLLAWSCLCVHVNLLLFGLVQLGPKKVALRCGDPSIFLPRKNASWTSHHLRLRLFDTWTDRPVFFILCIFFDFIYLFTCHFLTSPFICFSDLGEASSFAYTSTFPLAFLVMLHAGTSGVIFSTWQHLHPPWKIMDPSSGCLK